MRSNDTLLLMDGTLLFASYSVKAYSKYLISFPLLEVTNCDLEQIFSVGIRWFYAISVESISGLT